MDPEHFSLQERYAPGSVCYGCGPANAKGLHIRSYVHGGLTVAEWTPQPHHEAFSGVLNGGIIGTLLDCHSNWTAAWHLMVEHKAVSPPPTVTMEYAIKLHKPTPTQEPLRLSARPVRSNGRVVEVEAELTAGGLVTATCQGLFTSVKRGHPAYERWGS